MSENRNLIKGSICGVKLEEIEGSLMRDISYFDKLVDELARGKPLALVLTGQLLNELCFLRST